jgi:hypothetical protein
MNKSSSLHSELLSDEAESSNETSGSVDSSSYDSVGISKSTSEASLNFFAKTYKTVLAFSFNLF